MRYHDITKDDMLNGDGLRVVFWVAGCTHRCHNCQNPVTWDINGGLPFDDAAKEEIFGELRKDYISGITLSGGDPMHPQHRAEIFELAKEIREKFPTKTIWSYTGFLWEELQNESGMKYIDVLIDGEFKEELLNTKLHWVGSSNQRIIDVQKTLESGKICLWEDITATAEV